MSSRNLIKKYVDDKRGNFTIMAAGCTATIVFLCGAAVDASRGHHAKAKAQNIADSVALAAAVYVDQNGGPPESSTEGFAHNTVYQASDYGYEIYGNANASFKVLYDETNGEATVELEGALPTTFMKLAHFDNMPFSTRAVVKYRETDNLDPASIMFVLDNSGSMWFDDKKFEDGASVGPADAVRRIDALRANMTDLNNRLKLIDEKTGDTRFLRTGMMPYNDDIITSRAVDMKWGALSNNNITSMVPGGATNSSPPMTEAWNQLQGENSFHENESGHSPLKFVIFMTDGKNTVGRDIWVPEEGTNHWRRTARQRYCWYTWWGGRRCRNYTAEYFYPTDGPSDTEIPAPTDHSNWVEGKYVFSSDYQTQNTCEEMHAAGVKVYTVGFALEEGTYETNDWGAGDPDNFSREITTEDLGQSFALLSACASEGDHFILAEDQEALEKAFEKIGDDILLDIIRVKG